MKCVRLFVTMIKQNEGLISINISWFHSFCSPRNTETSCFKILTVCSNSIELHLSALWWKIQKHSDGKHKMCLYY